MEREHKKSDHSPGFEELRLELLLDVARRGVHAGAGSLLLVAFAVAADIDLFLRKPELLVAAICLVVINLLRLVASLRLSKRPPRTSTFSLTRWFYAALVWSSGGFWAFLSMCVLRLKGLDNAHSMLAMTMLAGIGASTSTAIAADGVFVAGFLLLTTIGPAFYMFSLGGIGHLLAGVAFAYGVFLFLNARVYRQNLMKLQAQRCQLREEKHLTRRIIDAIPGPVSFFDSDLRYRAVNRRLLDKQMLDEEALIGSRLGEKRGSSAVVDFVRDFASRPEVREANQKLAVDFPEGMRWHRVTLARDEKGGIICIAVDIQREVELEVQERENRARVANSAKLAALGEMAAGIAHEINNPLSIIAMRANQLEELATAGEVPSEALVKNARKINETCFRISKIIRGLRAIARDGEGDPFAPASAREIVEDVLGLCGERFRNHHIHLQVGEIPQVTFPCRPSQVAQVLLNLVTNAFDACQGGEGAWVKLEAEVRDGHLVFRVSDSGPGIPESLVEKIMEPFFTTKDVGKGTGLGLSISRRILADHQGRLELKRASGPTTFEASFRLSEAAEGSAEKRSA